MRRHFTLRLWRILAACALTLLAVAGPAAAAPAPDYRTGLRLEVALAGRDKRICVGDRVALAASVLKDYEIVDAGVRTARLYGVPLAAESSDPSIGALASASATTTLDGDPPGEARFSFIALKAGPATVTVRGTLNPRQLFGLALGGDTVSGSTDVVVEDCAYQANVTAVWRLADSELAATIVHAALVPDEGAEGHYHGSAEVTWAGATTYPPPCYVSHHPAPSRAHLAAETVGDDLLQVTVSFEPTPALLADLVCPDSTEPMPASQTLAPEVLRVWVPAAGGSAQGRPGLSGVEIESSSALVQVRRVTK